jgi:glyoxylase-like metal-dependent hydrolase (beta-lactamase superfamily II)
MSIERTRTDRGDPFLGGPAAPGEVAGGVHVLEVGTGMLRSNVYFVRAGSAWVLIDAGSAGCEDRIRQAADSLFGASARPAAILLTHIHPDHSGSAPGLSAAWDCPVYVHPDEMRFATADATTYFTAYEPYRARSRHWRPPPLDRWILLPAMHLIPRRRRDKLIEEQSLKARARALGAGGTVPGLPGWEFIPTPGHTPGHVSYFRAADSLLIAGDAVVTVELNSLRGLTLWTLGRQERKLAGPPRYFTWSRRVAEESVGLVDELRPAIVAPGHGRAMEGSRVAEELKALAGSLAVATAVAGPG